MSDLVKKNLGKGSRQVRRGVLAKMARLRCFTQLCVVSVSVQVHWKLFKTHSSKLFNDTVCGFSGSPLPVFLFSNEVNWTMWDFLHSLPSIHYDSSCLDCSPPHAGAPHPAILPFPGDAIEPWVDAAFLFPVGPSAFPAHSHSFVLVPDT